MHEYLLRISNEIWNRVVVEAKNRGLKKSEMFRELIEKGLLKIYEEEAKYEKIKYK